MTKFYNFWLGKVTTGNNCDQNKDHGKNCIHDTAPALTERESKQRCEQILESQDLAFSRVCFQYLLIHCSDCAVEYINQKTSVLSSEDCRHILNSLVFSQCIPEAKAFLNRTVNNFTHSDLKQAIGFVSSELGDADLYRITLENNCSANDLKTLFSECV